MLFQLGGQLTATPPLPPPCWTILNMDVGWLARSTVNGSRHCSLPRVSLALDALVCVPWEFIYYDVSLEGTRR